MTERKEHWESIYTNKSLHEVSWYQPKPEISLKLIKESKIPTSASIIDIGGGDSFLVDHLLDAGYSNLTVLDISGKAIERAQERLGSRAKQVEWIESDIINFQPQVNYDLWHDRAAFHFLTKENEILNYKSTLSSGIQNNGQLIIGTFSESGPDRCSGINIKKYSKEDLAAAFSENFEQVSLLNEVHDTPFNTIQDFTFAHLKRRI